jgi:hypothetical protein
MSLAAPPKAIYPDIDSAFSEIQEHAKEHGYALFRSYKKPSRVVFACDRAGKYDSRGKDPNTHSTKQRKNTGSKKYQNRMNVADSNMSSHRLRRLRGPSFVTKVACRECRKGRAKVAPGH